MVSFLNRLLTRMIEYDFESGEVTLRTDDEIFELGDDDPLLIEGVFQHKDFAFGSLGPVSKAVTKVRPDMKIKSNKTSSALGTLFGEGGNPKSLVPKNMDTAGGGTSSTVVQGTKQDIEAMATKWGNDAEFRSLNCTPRNASGNEPPRLIVPETSTHPSTLKGPSVHFPAKRLPTDRLVKIVYDFTPDKESENQLKARRGQQFWEMTRAAPSLPPDPEGWIYCVYSKDSSRQGWIPLTQIVFLGKSSKPVESYNDSVMSKSLPYMLQGYRRGISVGSKYKGLVFLYSMDNDTLMNHGSIPFPIGALKKHDLHDVGSIDAKFSSSSLTREQSTFLLEAEDNWKSRIRPKSAGGAFVTNNSRTLTNRPATANNRRQISSRNVNAPKDATAANVSSSVSLPQVNTMLESQGQSLSSSSAERVGNLGSFRDERSLSSQASILLSTEYGIRDKGDGGLDTKVAASIPKKLAQVYGRNAYLLPSLK